MCFIIIMYSVHLFSLFKPLSIQKHNIVYKLAITHLFNKYLYPKSCGTTHKSKLKWTSRLFIHIHINACYKKIYDTTDLKVGRFCCTERYHVTGSTNIRLALPNCIVIKLIKLIKLAQGISPLTMYNQTIFC